MVHHEAHRTRACGGDDEPVHVAHVIAYQNRRTRLGNVLESRFFQAIDGVHQQPDEEAHQKLGHQRVDVYRHGGVEQSRGQEELRNAQAEVEQRNREDGRSHDEKRVQHVVAGDDARTVARLRPGLDERIEGHDVKTPEDPDQGEVGEDAPVRGLPDEIHCAGRRVRCEARARKIEIDAEERQSDRAERHQADLDPVAREPLAQKRTDADPDGEQGEQYGHDLLRAEQDVLRVDGELRQVQRAEKPEP